MTIDDKRMKQLGPWPLGINNVAKDTEVPNAALRKALNVDLTDEGKPHRRGGYASIHSGSNIRSLFTAGSLTVFAEGGDLKRLFPNDSSTTLSSSVHSLNNLDYEEVNDIVYFTDGDSNFKMTLGGVVSSLGLPRAVTVPTVTASTNGELKAGDYQVAVTEETSSGEESGVGEAVDVTIASDGGSIVVSNLPATSGAAYVNVYVTKWNGERLYHRVRALQGTSSITIRDIALLGKELETQFMDQMPAGHIIFYYKGRIWIAQDNVLWYSEPMRYGLTKLSTNFIQFPERITIAKPVIDGIYVCSDNTYFLAGENPKQMRQVVVSTYGAVEGTDISLPADVFSLEGVNEEVAYWFGDNGAVLGLPSGQIQYITEDRLAVPEYTSGASMRREESGLQQVLSAVKDPGDTNSLAVGDTVSATIVRNGITIT